MGLIVEDHQVRELITMRDAIDTLRAAYREDAAGGIIEAARSNLILPDVGFLRIMAAAAPGWELAGYKEFHRVHGQVRYAYHLIDTRTGEPLAVLDANFLTLLRTGACGGLAVDLLARPEARVLGVVGSGAEARSQVSAVLAVREIERVQVFSRTAERRERFCADIRETHEVEAVAFADPAHALDGVDVIVVATATGGTGPAFRGDWLDHPGVHINSIGSTLPSQREIDEHVWSRCHHVIIDAELLLDESGDAIAADMAGTLDRERVRLLRDVVSGAVAGRMKPTDVTLYKSVGSALQDLAVAADVYRRARGDRAQFAQMRDFQSVAEVTG